MVVDGLLATVDAFTKRPVEALRYTERLLRVEPPTRSVVVRLGARRAYPLVTKRPEDALRDTVRARAI